MSSDYWKTLIEEQRRLSPEDTAYECERCGRVTWLSIIRLFNLGYLCRQVYNNRACRGGPD